MMKLLVVWLINAVALIAVAYLMPSVAVSSFGAALVAALVLGLVNAVVRPVLVLLTLPVTLLTLGLFIFVLNGLLFWMVGTWLEGFAGRRVLAGGVRLDPLQPGVVAAFRAGAALIILPYLGYGTPDRLAVRGRVLEDEGFLARRPTRDTRWRNLGRSTSAWNRTRCPARACVARCGRQRPVTDGEGYFALRARCACRTRGGTRSTLELLHPPGAKARGTRARARRRARASA